MVSNNSTAKKTGTKPSVDLDQPSSRQGCATGSTAAAQAAVPLPDTFAAPETPALGQVPDFAAIAHAAGRRAAVEWRVDLAASPIAESKLAAWFRFAQSAVTAHASAANFAAGFDSVAEQFSTGAQVPRNLDVIDMLNARHNQVLGILSCILSCIQADLDEEPTLTPATLSNTLWAAQTLLEQAQEAARQL